MFPRSRRAPPRFLGSVSAMQSPIVSALLAATPATSGSATPATVPLGASIGDTATNAAAALNAFDQTLSEVVGAGVADPAKPAASLASTPLAAPALAGGPNRAVGK